MRGIDFRANIEAALDSALQKERLPLRVTGTDRTVLVPEKFDRVVANTERRLRQEGTIRP